MGLKTYSGTLNVLDATAGLGRDAFVLASLGCVVHLVERSPMMAAVLQDGLERAAKDPIVAKIVQQNMQVSVGDAKVILEQLLPENFPDIVYLDPMFPHSEKGALPKLEMRIIREVVGGDADADMLLHLAIRKARKRVVVKRSQRAPHLGLKPNFVVGGQSTRYDVYLIGGESKIYA